MHWRLHPAQAESCGNFLGPREDALSIGFRNGTDHVVQYSFLRARKHFTARELAILDLLGPVLQRLARERPTPRLPATLTITERRILCDVAAGFSNAEIAEDYSVAVSTVRKHLENAYRKLGVTNRMAAIARLRGSDEPGASRGCAVATCPGSTCRSASTDSPEGVYRSDPSGLYPRRDGTSAHVGGSSRQRTAPHDTLGGPP